MYSRVSFYVPWIRDTILANGGLSSCDFSLIADPIEGNNKQEVEKTRSSWLNCALRDDEAVYWVSIGHYEAVAVGNW